MHTYIHTRHNNQLPVNIKNNPLPPILSTSSQLSRFTFSIHSFIHYSMSFQMRSLMPSSMRSGATTTKQQGGLPVSQTHSKQQQQQQQQQEQGLRRRLSSLSLKIQPSPEAADATYSWVLRRSKSVSSMGEYAGSSIRKWWDWGCGWILSRKPTFARDLEMNEQETAVLGCHSKGSWRHVFYKLRKLLVRPHHNLPQTFRYDSVTYSQNFDDGIGKINTRSQLNH